MCIVFEIYGNMVQCTQLREKSVYGVEIDEKLVEGVKSGCRLFWKGLKCNYIKYWANCFGVVCKVYFKQR